MQPLLEEDPADASAGGAEDDDEENPEEVSDDESPTDPADDDEDVPSSVSLTPAWTHRESFVAYHMHVTSESILTPHSDGFVALDHEDGTERWSVDTDGSVGWMEPSRLVDDRLYLATDDGMVQSIDVDSGTVDTLYETDSSVRKLEVSERYLGVGLRIEDADGDEDQPPTVTVLDRERGDVVTAIEGITGGDEFRSHSVTPSLVTFDGHVAYVGTARGIEAVDLESGDRSFVTEPGQIGSRSPAVEGTTADLVSDEELFSHDLPTGTTNWTHSLQGVPESDVTLTGDAVVGVDEAGVYCVDTAEGVQRWREEFEDDPTTGVDVYDGVCWYATDEHRIVARSVETGENVLDTALSFDTVHAITADRDWLAVSTPNVETFTIDD